MAYLDTSVLAAYYCPERLSRKVQQALDDMPEPTISPLVEVELHSALAMKVRARDMSASAAGQVASMFQMHLSDGFFQVVPIEAKQYALARNWIGSFRTALRTLDALHLAAAFSHNLSLVSADRSLVRAADQFEISRQLIS